MKSIHYANDELLTGDAIADALVRLAEALARHETATAVDVPIRFPNGDLREVSFLLGPASQIVAIPVDSTLEDVVDDEIVARLNHLTETAGTRSAHYIDDVDTSHPYDEFDLS